MLTRRFSIALIAVIGVLTACSASGPPSSATTTGSTPTASAPTPTAAATGTPFVSTHYLYSVTSADWTGTDATTAWDGKGSPGDADPSVDTLVGPEGQRAFAYGEPMTATVQEFAATSRMVTATVHPCPTEPQTTGPTTIGGEPAILDEEHCPVSGGPYVITAYVVHAGHAYVFFTYSIPAGTEAFTRSWFVSLLTDISFSV